MSLTIPFCRASSLLAITALVLGSTAPTVRAQTGGDYDARIRQLMSHPAVRVGFGQLFFNLFIYILLIY